MAVRTRSRRFSIPLATTSPRLAIGLMSGTSMDGVDAALVEIQGSGLDTRCRLLHFHVHPYPDGLKEAILELAGPDSAKRLCQLNVVIGKVFADATLALLARAGRSPEEVAFIGSHGQTVQHWPEATTLFGYPVRATLQIGEPAVIAKETGIVTVADFRPADLALDGQGAPLVPYFDWICFRDVEKNRLIVNLGGIANLTVLRKQADRSEVVAFDTGPGNMVIDALMSELFQRPYDRDGAVAQSGRVSEELLQFAMNHAYFKQRPPKSTGRESFGEAFVASFLEQARALGLSPTDSVATATELTAATVAQGYHRFVEPEVSCDEVIVSGGGTENATLMRALAARFACPVRRSDEFGIPSEAKEAMCFAVLANETLCLNPGNVPSATGAREATILGKICL